MFYVPDIKLDVVVGAGNGKCYSVNVPLKEGMDDLSYELIFQPIMRQVKLP